MKILESCSSVSFALFFVFCGLSILASKSEQNLSALGLESIAPQNLRTAAERFRLALIGEQTAEIRGKLSEAESAQVLKALEKNSGSIERISKTESWSQLEAKLSAYADRIEVLTQQRHFMSSLVNWGMLASAVAMLIFSIASSRKNQLPGESTNDAYSQSFKRKPGSDN